MKLSEIKIGDRIKCVAVGNTRARVYIVRKIAVREGHAVLRVLGQSKIVFLLEGDAVEFINHVPSVAIIHEAEVAA